MNISTIDNVSSMRKELEKATPEQVRKVAVDFETLLLTQLTSAMNKTAYEPSDGGDEPLFGSDGGTDLTKQLFSEQLAKTISEAGGVGLANILMRQFGVEPEKLATGIKGFQNAISAVKDIKADAPVKGSPLINRSAKAEPLAKLDFAGDPNDAEVISTFEDQVRSEGIEESLRNLILDGRIVNTTRSRLAPNAAITLDSGTSETKAASGPLKYRYPVAGLLTSDIGNRVHPIDGKVKFHAGLDLAVPPGTSVQASAEGVVSFAGWSGGYGNLLVVKHADGRETRYGHLNKLLVTEGDTVSAGQVVALSGSTGRSTGPHVHFEIRENGQVLNPLNILTKGLE
ncbi:MAG TPA: peptidoglycan DD-metalloendopeptidase family protein [Pyrinomonadaceae bacterium]|nr:peptidoglycan DD-metalloendopeptidase family protein [Pyrinomonadaceae bacterium]